MALPILRLGEGRRPPEPEGAGLWQIPGASSRSGFLNLSIALIGAVLGVASVAWLASPYPALALVPSLGVILLLVLARFPALGFYFLVGYIPFQNYTTLLVVGDQDSFTIQKVIGSALIFALLISAILKKRSMEPLRSNLWPWLVGFWVSSLLSFILSDYPVPAASELRRQFLDLVYFTLALVFLTDQRVLSRNVPAVIVATVVVSALLSLVAYAGHIDSLSLTVQHGEDFWRGQGGSHDPNLFSSIVVFTLPLLVHWFHTTTHGGSRAAIFVFGAICIAAIVVTFSRGGLLIFAVAAIMIFIEYMGKLRPRHLGFFALTATVALIGFVVLVPQSYWERQSTTFSKSDIKTDYSLSRRISYLVVGWEEFKERPILGAGPGTFAELYGATPYAQIYAEDETELKRVAHNTYLSTLVSTGLVGFLFFVGALVVAWRNYLRAEALFAKAGNDRMLSLTKAFKISFLTFLLTFVALSAENEKFFWLSLGISQAVLTVAKRRPEAG
jgi:O-antigen ligase